MFLEWIAVSWQYNAIGNIVTIVYWYRSSVNNSYSMVTKRYSKVCDMSTSVPGMQDILYDFGLVVGIPGHVVTLVSSAEQCRIQWRWSLPLWVEEFPCPPLNIIIIIINLISFFLKLSQMPLAACKREKYRLSWKSNRWINRKVLSFRRNVRRVRLRSRRSTGRQVYALWYFDQLASKKMSEQHPLCFMQASADTGHLHVRW